MRIEIENIGKVKQASVEIDGITAIAGENDTGKSTVGKSLYAVFNGFYSMEDRIRRERDQRIEREITNLFTRATGRFIGTYRRELINDLTGLHDSNTANKENVKGILKRFADSEGINQDRSTDRRIDDAAETIEYFLQLSDKELTQMSMESKLLGEFCGQVNNIYNNDEGNIRLVIRGDVSRVRIEKNKVKEIDTIFSLQTKAVYIDDPFVVDSKAYFRGRSNNHREELERLLHQSKETGIADDLYNEDRLSKVYEILNMVCKGAISIGEASVLQYVLEGSDEWLDIRNLSTGMKAFAILKLLLINGIVENNGVMILDEPEIHLHPDWQIIYAEVIVLLQKLFGLHILLNTHSPYFLRAVEVFAHKHGIQDRCRYYFAKNKADVAFMDDVTENTEVMYQTLVKALQKLEDLRWDL